MARVVIERILQKRMDSGIVYKWYYACMVLHNFCIDADDIWDEEFIEGASPTNNETIGDGDSLHDLLKIQYDTYMNCVVHLH